MKLFFMVLILLGTAIHDASGVAGKKTGRKAYLASMLTDLNLNYSQSIKVVRLSDGKSLFEIDSKVLLTPASVSKLVTSAAALVKFGPSKQFKTRFYRSGPLKNGTVSGDLVVVGDGDPYLVSELLWQFAADLRHMGIREIRGDLVIDNSLFDSVGRDESRKNGLSKSTHAYDSPVSAFGVNFNTVALAIAPGTGVGKKGLINLDPYQISGVKIENRTKTSGSLASNGVKVVRESNQNGTQKLVASGLISKEKSLQKIYRSSNNHLLTSGETVRAFLKAEGIFIKGKVRPGRKKTTDVLLYELSSYPLSRIVEGLNQYSNNYIADVLVKRMGAAFPIKGPADGPHQGSYKNGKAVLAAFLKENVGIKSRFVMENGSGLSTKNKLSADQITSLLVYMSKKMDVFPEFLNSLPASGRTGTLKKRFSNDKLKVLFGKVRAKTGTLKTPHSVSALAGDLNHPRHGMIAFAIIQNGLKGKKQPGIADLREIQDRAIAGILKYL